MRPADQLVQREDLLLLVVLDGASGRRDVPVDAVVVPAYCDSERSTPVRATLRQPRHQTEGQSDAASRQLYWLIRAAAPVMVQHFHAPFTLVNY